MTKEHKLCLSIDTASDMTSVALCDDKGECAVARMISTRGQGEALMSLIQDVFQQMGKSCKDLTHIAATVGPGSFTGVRIGLATARGLGLALNVPVLGVDSFVASAYGLKRAVTVVLDSKRDDYFVQNFDKNGKAVNDPALKTIAQLKDSLPFVACGSGADRLAQDIKCKVVLPVQDLSLSVAQIVLNHPERTVLPHPLYLREADVTI